MILLLLLACAPPLPDQTGTGDTDTGTEDTGPEPVEWGLGTVPFVALGLGSGHACGLRAAGEAVCWGGDHYGQTDAPAGDFVEVGAGEDHTCALGRDGALAC